MADEPGTGPHGLRALVHARILAFVREPAVLFWVFAFPALLALALGMAFRDEPAELPRIGLATDRAPQPSDATVLQILRSSERLVLEERPLAQLEERLQKGGVDLILDWSAATPPAFELRFDPKRAEGAVARLILDDVLQEGLGRRDVAELRERTEMPRGGRYIDFLMPGLIAMNLMSSALWGVGYGMVQERSKKLMRRFATTPLTRTSFLGSYILSRLLFLAVEVAFLIGFGALVFDVTVQGSVATFFFVALVGVLSFTGFAVLCAARTASVEVVQGFINALTLPMWLLSGTFFSYERFPEALHPLIQMLPLTALNDGLRMITNEGATLFEVLPQLGVLTGWGVLTFALGVRLFRWR
jgi:ABC-2 type transport system permease protein